MTEAEWEDVNRGWNTDDKCPHCGEVIHELYEYFGHQDYPTFDCPSCEKPIEGSVMTKYILQRPKSSGKLYK